MVVLPICFFDLFRIFLGAPDPKLTRSKDSPEDACVEEVWYVYLFIYLFVCLFHFRSRIKKRETNSQSLETRFPLVWYLEQSIHFEF